MKRAIIFDFDGTIADSLPAVVEVFEELTRRPQRFTPEQIKSLQDLSIPELLTVLKVPKWKVPLLLMRGRRMIRAHLHGIAVHSGVAEAIKQLHAAGIPLYVLSSNSTENVQKYLQWHKLSPYFSGVYGGASLLGKAPRLFKLIDKEALDVAGSWYVGDETRDIIAARAVGLHIVSVSWGYNTRAALAAKKPDAVVHSASQLRKLLAGKWQA
jgi:phosphoglycolate phosphatase-like HAD superfamily hydrolase